MGGWRARFALAGLALVAVAACGYRGPALPRLASDDVILAFGDSLTYGTGASEQESYPAVLQTLIRRRVVREGVPGELTEQGLERLPGLLDQHHPRLLLLCMGGNDMLRHIDPATTEANLRAMIAMARSRGIGVVLIGVPQPQLLGGAAEVYGKLAREAGVPVENEILKSVLHDGAYKSDLIHPNAAGYRRLAEALADLLHRAGAV
jgi:lysophospholipase L1-like esterase